MTASNKKDLSLVNNVWAQRDLGLDLSKNLKSVTHADVEYVCNHVYPFIQLVNLNAVLDEGSTVKFIPASTGWTIHDYGDAISTSAPYGSDGGLEAQVVTVSEIAYLIAKKGWVAVELIAGTQMMQRLIWIESKRYGFTFDSYAPTESDEKCCDRLVKHIKDWEKHAPVSPEHIKTGAVGAS